MKNKNVIKEISIHYLTISCLAFFHLSAFIHSLRTAHDGDINVYLEFSIMFSLFFSFYFSLFSSPRVGHASLYYMPPWARSKTVLLLHFFTSRSLPLSFHRNPFCLFACFNFASIHVMLNRCKTWAVTRPGKTMQITFNGFVLCCVAASILCPPTPALNNSLQSSGENEKPLGAIYALKKIVI